jgi:copper homeostasis protein
MMPNRILVEIAVFTPSAAIAAAKAGANRIELCSGFSEGGLSPSAGTIMQVRQSVTIPIHVMIRPRIGDFVYNYLEKKCILNDIEFCKQYGIDGIVVGALTDQGMVDTDFIKQVVEVAKPMSVTFHRAFDLCPNLFMAMELLIGCGVSRILTSGGKTTVVDGIEVISNLVARANNRIVILPGGGVKAVNAKRIIEETQVKELHLSAKELVYSSMKSHSEVNFTSVGQVSDANWYECSADSVKEILEVIK